MGYLYFTSVAKKIYWLETLQGKIVSASYRYRPLVPNGSYLSRQVVNYMHILPLAIHNALHMSMYCLLQFVIFLFYRVSYQEHHK